MTVFTLLALSVPTLTSCGSELSGPPLPTVSEVDLTGPVVATIGKPAAVTARVTMSTSTDSASAVAYTSSAPNVVSVDAQGVLNVKRLTPTNTPVTITATAGGKSDALQITTYGLEAVTGTASYYSSLSDFLVYRFRSFSMTDLQNLTFTYPDGSIYTAGSHQLYKGMFSGSLSSDSKLNTGAFKISFVHDGETFQLDVPVADNSGLMDAVDGADASVSGRTITVTGTPPARAKYFDVVLFGVMQDYSYGGGKFTNSLPVTFTALQSAPAGTYNVTITAYSEEYFNYMKLLPDRIDASTTSAGLVSLR